MESKTLVLFLVSAVNCAFFDLTDVEDPLSLLWQGPKDFTLPQKNTPCIVPIPGTGTVIPGQCRHKTLCLLSGGQTHTHDNCGSFLTCCTQNLICTKRTKSKISYFTNDGLSSATDCEYIVERYNDHVCQVRLDFEHFQLSAATEVTIATDSFRSVCSNDYLTVTPDTYGIPQFCGNNDGQHVYVHLQDQKEMKLRVHVADRANTVTDATNPKWRIRVTQIECPIAQNYFLKQKIYVPETDFRLLAPEGSIQYFTEPSGRIRSFGFNGGEGSYTSGLKYAISFKRTPQVNCLWFRTNFITLRHQAKINDTDFDVCLDYLFVPDYNEVIGSTFRFGSQLCSRQGVTPQHSQIFYTDVPGPFNIFFRSQPSYSKADDALAVHAFDIHYELKTC